MSLSATLPAAAAAAKPMLAAPASKRLVLDGISKRFGSVTALAQMSLDVQPGELVALLGPSGCGKTTTLRIIAGFEFADTGAVRIGNQDISHLPPNKRGLGMVFQNYSLFPHLSVGENIGFGLRMAGMPASERAAQVRRMLDLIRLPGIAERRVAQLSGGQQQRVALARALVTNPSVLLLDEPLGALDKNLREGMQFELRQLQRRLGITSVMVTHDQEEALTMITDAFAALGMLGQAELGYNAVRVDGEAAVRAIALLARRLGSDVQRTAEAIVNVAVSGMYAGVSRLVSRFGIDPRTFVLLPFGGAGPMLACYLARALNMQRNRDRTHFGAWGVLGGRAGSTSRFTRNPRTPQAQDLGNTDLLSCAPGDVIRLEGAGGGGWGHPFERDPQRVLDDVRRGHVSIEAARECYAVGIVDGEVDGTQTAALREIAAANAASASGNRFDFGASRDAHEARWTRARYAALTERLATVPVAWRFFVKHRMFEALAARCANDTAPAGTALVPQLFDALLAEYPDLAKPLVTASVDAGLRTPWQDAASP